MAATLVAAARAPAQPLPRTTVPTIATVTALASRIARVERRVARLPDERLDAEQVPLMAERDRLMDRLAGTRARTLAEVRTKLRLALADLRDGDHDTAADLLTGAIGDLGRLDGS